MKVNKSEDGLFKPVKVMVSAWVDADIVQWLKSEGRGYQTRMNQILRQEMIRAMANEGKDDV